MSNPFFYHYEREMFLANCWNDDCILGLFFMSASLGKAQEFILKTVESPVSGSPSNRSEGLLSTHWTQDYPYNQFCPRDPMNDYSYSYAGCPAVAMAQIVNFLQVKGGDYQKTAKFVVR